jgi:hypothetical protein
LRDDAGRAWFIELNGRPWGSMALARRLGLEYPAWAVLQVLDPAYEPAVPPQLNGGVTCRHLGRDLVHLLIVMRGPRSRALARWPSRWRTARDVLRVGRNERFYNWRAGESKLFVHDTVQTVVDQVRRRRP